MTQNWLIETGPVLPERLSEFGREALDIEIIASIPDQIIEEMTSLELIRLIQASGHPWRPRLVNLEYASQADLKRLACLARYCCRNRLTREPQRFCQ